MEGFEAIHLLRFTAVYVLGFILPVANKGWVLTIFVFLVAPEVMRGKRVHVTFITLFFIAGSFRGLAEGPSTPDRSFLEGGERVRCKGVVSSLQQSGPLVKLSVEGCRIERIDGVRREENVQRCTVRFYGNVEYVEQYLNRKIVALGRVKLNDLRGGMDSFTLNSFLSSSPYTIGCSRKRILFLPGVKNRESLIRRARSRIISALRSSTKYMVGRDFVISILTGIRSYRSPVRKILKSGGLVHLQAISGLHVGAALFLFAFLVRVPLTFLNQHGLSFDANPITNLAGLSGAFLYACMSGLAVPVERAFSMILFGLLWVRKGDRRSWTEPLFFALFTVAIANPSSIVSVSLVFSFLITFFLLMVLSQPLSGSHKAVKKGFLVVFTAYLVSVPLSAFFFHHGQVKGFLLNALFVPLFTPLIVFSLSWALFTLVFPAAGKILAILPAAVGDYLLRAVSVVESIVGGWVEMEPPHFARVLIFFICLAAIICCSIGGKEEKSSSS